MGGFRQRVPTQNTPHEERLAARFQAGESEALSALFEMYVDRVFAYSKHLLGNREDAEEVTSEAFLRAFERAATFRGECPFRGWLFAIARNLCLDRLRQPKLLLMESEEIERSTDSGRSASQMETSIVVRKAVSELSEEHRIVLMLCDAEQWDASEVALMTDRTLAATKSILYRARRALRAKLTEMWE